MNPKSITMDWFISQMAGTNRILYDFVIVNNNQYHKEPFISKLHLDACLLLSVSCRLSSVICHLPSVFCHLSSAVCLLLSVSCRLSSVICPLPSVIHPLFSAICFLSSGLCHLRKHRGQVFILDRFICFSNLSIFLFSFLSFSILWATRLQACETPDSPMPNCSPMSFSFLAVFL